MNSLPPDSHLFKQTFSTVQKNKSSSDPHLHPAQKRDGYEKHISNHKSYKGKTDPVNLFNSVKNDWDNTPVLKKKDYGYVPKKGKFSASSSDFYKTSNVKKNSNFDFRPLNENNDNIKGDKERVSKNPVANNKIASFNKTSFVPKNRVRGFSPREEKNENDNENDNENNIRMVRDVKSPVAKSKLPANRPSSSDLRKSAKGFSPRNENNDDFNGKKEKVSKNPVANFSKTSYVAKNRVSGFSPKFDDRDLKNIGLDKASKELVAKNKVDAKRPSSSYARKAPNGFSPKYQNNNDKNTSMDMASKETIAKNKVVAKRPSSSITKSRVGALSPKNEKDTYDNNNSGKNFKSPVAKSKMVRSFNKTSFANKNKETGFSTKTENIDDKNTSIDMASKETVAKNKVVAKRPSSSITKSRVGALSPRNQKDTYDNNNNNSDKNIKSPVAKTKMVDKKPVSKGPVAKIKNPERKGKLSVSRKKMPDYLSEKEDESGIKHSIESFPERTKAEKKSVDIKPRSSVTKEPLVKNKSVDKKAPSSVSKKPVAKSRVSNNNAKVISIKREIESEGNLSKGSFTESPKAEKKSVDKKPRSFVSKEHVAKTKVSASRPSSSLSKEPLAKTRVSASRPSSSLSKEPLAKTRVSASRPSSSLSKEPLAKTRVSASRPSSSLSKEPLAKTRVSASRPSSSVPKNKAKEISIKDEIEGNNTHSLDSIHESPIPKKKYVEKNPRSSVSRDPIPKTKGSTKRPNSSVSKEPAAKNKNPPSRPSSSVSRTKQKEILIKDEIETNSNVSIITIPESPIAKTKVSTKRPNSSVSKEPAAKNKVSASRPSSSVSKNRGKEISIKSEYDIYNNLSMISIPESPIAKKKSVEKKANIKNNLRNTSAGFSNFNRSSKQTDKPNAAADKVIKTQTLSKPVKIMPSKN